MPVATEKAEKLGRDAKREALRNLRAMQRGLIRRRVLREGRIDVLIREVLGYELLPFHLALLEHQQTVGDNIGAIEMAPRGYGKSTILTICRTIFEIIRNPDIRILIASNTAAQSEVPLREIKQHLEENTELLSIFGEFANTRGKWDVREISVLPRQIHRKEATVTTLGVGGPVTGRHYDLIISDDLVDEENSWTEGQREKTRTWFYKTLLPTLEPHGRHYINGTRYHHLDLYGHLLRNELKGRSLRVRALEPDSKGGFTTPWPEKFSVDYLLSLKRRLGSAIFSAQYQNDTALLQGDIFREEWLRYYDESPKWREFDHWVGCDPAATKADRIRRGDGSQGDYWAAAVVARKRTEDGDYEPELYVRDVLRGRMTKNEYLAALVRWRDLYDPISFSIESVAAQEYLAQDAERQLPVRRVERDRDKTRRAYGVQPYFENGQVLLPRPTISPHPDNSEALREELLLMPDGQHDDLFDALETAISACMKPRRVGVMVL